MITFLFMLIFDIINMIFIKNYNLSNCFYYILITSIKGIAFPFVDTIAKKMMVNHYTLPYLYMIYKCIFESIIFVIITII